MKPYIFYSVLMMLAIIIALEAILLVGFARRGTVRSLVRPVINRTVNRSLRKD